MNDAELYKRLTRIESRLVQLMIHMGSDPYERTYDNLSDTKHSTTTGANTQSESATERYKRSKLERRNRLSSLSACSPF